MCKIFSLKKTFHQQKLTQTKCLLSNSWMTKSSKTPTLPKLQVPNDFFGDITVNFLIQKLKSKLSLVSSFHEGTRENAFKIFWALYISHILKFVLIFTLPSYFFCFPHHYIQCIVGIRPEEIFHGWNGVEGHTFVSDLLLKPYNYLRMYVQCTFFIVNTRDIWNWKVYTFVSK